MTASVVEGVPSWAKTPPRSGELFVDIVDGSKTERRCIDEKGYYLVGRNDQLCDIVIDHKSASRTHLCICHHAEGAVYIKDLSSRHGTFLNDEKLEKDEQKAIKCNDDEVRLGSCPIVLVFTHGSDRGHEGARDRKSRSYRNRAQRSADSESDDDDGDDHRRHAKRSRYDHHDNGRRRYDDHDTRYDSRRPHRRDDYHDDDRYERRGFRDRDRDFRDRDRGYNRTRTVCKFFNTPQGCRNGDRCWFLHVERGGRDDVRERSDYRRRSGRDHRDRSDDDDASPARRRSPRSSPATSSPAAHAKASSPAAAAATAATTGQQAPAAGQSSADIVKSMMGMPGGSGLTVDEKKRMLWKRTQEPAAPDAAEVFGSNRWDAAEFKDEHEKDKFQRLMGVRGEGAPPSASEMDADAAARKALSRDEQSKVLGDIEQQFSAGLRRADGRTVGLGL